MSSQARPRRRPAPHQYHVPGAHNDVIMRSCVRVRVYVRTYVHIHGQARPRGAAINGLASSPNSVFVTAYVAFEPSAVLVASKPKVKYAAKKTELESDDVSGNGWLRSFLGPGNDAV